MTDRPILFKAEMRAAIREGRKTQTRRILTGYERDDLETALTFDAVIGGLPYHINDRLWVREPLYRHAPRPKSGKAWARYADDDRYVPVRMPRGGLSDLAWRWNTHRLSPLHMPREAARLWLVVLAVRIERVQDISEADAQAEGVIEKASEGPMYPSGRAAHRMTYRAGFGKLWDRINAPRGYPWSANDWVAVYTFAPIEVAP